MRLPVDPDRRHHALVELGRYCSGDRSQRKSYHQELRNWYTQGTGSGERSRFNKLRSHVRQSAAYLYQSESVRFGCVLDPEYGDRFNEELDTIAVHLHRYWHGSRAGVTMGVGVEWAHVYPTVVFKVIPSAGDAVVTLVPDPADIGVLENDRPFDRQEALCHFYTLTLSQFRRLILGHPREKELMATAYMESESGGSSEPLEPAIERIAFQSTSPRMQGVITPGSIEPQAQVEVPRVLMAELWVVDDRLHDWRVATCLAPAGQVSAVVWDRRTPVLSQTDPFVALTLSRAPDYTWGFSEVDDLTGLQQWREDHLRMVDDLMELQLRPPIVLGGFGGLSDERAKRLRTPNGVLATSLPNPSVNRLAPQMPPEAFGLKDSIDRDFAEQGGLPILLQGQGEAGIRAGNQVGVLATLASARIRENAMRVEYATSEVATLALRLERELHGTPLEKPDGTRFLMTEVPRSIEALVSSHSASPLYAAAIKADALEMLKVGAIDRPSYVRLKDPPEADILAAKARRLEEAAAKRSERLLMIQEQKALHGRTR